MLTPFCDDGSVDFDGLRRLTDFYLDSGSAGLFANCLSSEMFQLSPMERLGIVECVVQQAAGRAPVVACGNFGRDPAAVCAFIRKMADTGAAAVVLITGLLAGPEEDEGRLREAVEAILEKTRRDSAWPIRMPPALQTPAEPRADGSAGRKRAVPVPQGHQQPAG
jgi:4-hydroxy-tetrahydrodipicolinate synthase